MFEGSVVTTNVVDCSCILYDISLRYETYITRDNFVVLNLTHGQTDALFCKIQIDIFCSDYLNLIEICVEKK